MIKFGLYSQKTTKCAFLMLDVTENFTFWSLKTLPTQYYCSMYTSFFFHLSSYRGATSIVSLSSLVVLFVDISPYIVLFVLLFLFLPLFLSGCWFVPFLDLSTLGNIPCFSSWCMCPWLGRKSWHDKTVLTYLYFVTSIYFFCRINSSI